MPEKTLFTMAKLASLKPFKAGRRTVYDEKVPGLTICVTESGGKSFYLYGRFGGRPQRIRLGGFPELSVDDAREKARKLIPRIVEGDKPAEAKRKERGELTLGGLWGLYLEFHGPHKKASSLTEDGRLWKRYLQSWESKKLSAIENADVRKWHSRIGRDHGKYAANRALSLLSKMYSLAADHGEWNEENPCAGVTKFAEKSRDRFLQPDELPTFLAALDALPDQQVAGAFRLCLLTGARKGNVLAMRWSELDLVRGVWNIPDTKGNEPLRVPLVPEAVEVLETLRESAGESPFVFPAREAGAVSGHLQNIQKHWKAVIDAAKLPGLRPHDLRRTMGSWQALGGASLQVIGGSLGHKHASTTQIYSRLTIDPVRASMTKAASAMTATTKPAAADDDEPLGVG